MALRPLVRPGSRVLTVLAALLVLYALVGPDQLGRLTPAPFLRIPVEALLVVALLLVLPARAGRVLAAGAGLGLGLLTVLKIVDLGFFAVLARPFDPVLDWIFVGNGVEFLTSAKAFGRVGAWGMAIAIGVLAVTVLVLTTLSVLRLSRLAVRHRTASTRAVAGLGAAWVTLAVLGTQLPDGRPVAAGSAATLAFDTAVQVRDGLHDRRAFEREASVDAFAATPGADLLAGLRDKDVLVAFVESYGRSAVQDPRFAPQVGAVLADGDRTLASAGFASRSSWLTSPTAGGGSWLAHASLLSGLWIDNQQRYDNLVAGDRMTLNRAFQKAGWRTVAVMPGITRAWPDGAYFGYDRIYDSRDLGYRGPSFSWAPMPDQFTLAAYQREELASRDRAPVMAELPLVSSHAPWAPIPQLLGWDRVGDGSVFAGQPAAGRRAGAVWRNSDQVRTEYRRSIEYSLTTLISWLQEYGDDDTVLVLLGDHQPTPIVTGPGASRDVPITIVAHDPAVLKKIDGWGWSSGLKPGSEAPVWPMSAFRDRFLTAFAGTPTEAP